VDKVKGRELLDKANKVMIDHVDPYIDEIIARKPDDDDSSATKHPASNNGADYVADHDDDGFTGGKVDGANTDDDDIEYDEDGNPIDPLPF